MVGTYFIEILVMLDLFRGDFDVLELCHNWSIVKVPQNRVDELNQKFRFNSFLHPLGPITEYALRREFDDEKVFEDEDSDFRYTIRPLNLEEETSRIVSGLRVLTEGAFAVGDTHLFPSNYVPFRTVSIVAGGRRLQPYGKVYTLPAAYAERVKEFMTAWFSFSEPPMVRGAIRRLDFAMERDTPEDRILDFMIAFEALLLDQRGELKLRLAIRTASLLGESSEERVETFERMKLAYEVRSRVVHGEEEKVKQLLEKKNTNLLELVNEIEMTLKKAIARVIRKYFDEPNMNHEEFLNSLEQRILGPPEENE